MLKIPVKAIVVICSLSCLPVYAQQVQRPNIIFILTDDQRWDALGYAGNRFVSTPAMDQLARSGTYFSQALVTTPICSASRASIWSGVQERSHGYSFTSGPISEEYMKHAYPKLLRDAGYHTAFYGKFGVNYDGKDRLFDVYEDYDRDNRYRDKRGYFYKTIEGDTVHLTRYTGQQAIDFIDTADPRKPFCLSLSFSAPHAHDAAPDQYFWQPETDSLLQEISIPPPPLSDDKYFEQLPASVKSGFNRLRWTWRFDTPEKYQHSVKGYYRMISGIDREIARIREKLEEKGLDDNTVIILMGDNGYFLGERQLAGKWLMYENSVRVPLIVYDPRAKRHQDIDDMALNVDVPATILDLAGVKQPATWHGMSLSPIVNAQVSRLNRDTVLIEHLWAFEDIPPSEGVRTAEWKYLRYVNDKSIEELYHLSRDPQEKRNLAKDKKYKTQLLSLRAACDALGEQKSDGSTAPPTHLTVETIRNPKGVKVVDPYPEFGWRLAPVAGYQSAYQLLVASSRQQLANNIGDVWDSGQVRSSRSTGVSFGGRALKPQGRYYWKVRIWDEHNKVSRYAEPQAFEAGEQSETLTTPNVFQVERIKPAKINKVADGCYFIDFGKAAFATLEFNYRASASDTLVVRLGEQLESGRINRKPQGTIRYQEILVPVTPEQERYTVRISPDQRNSRPPAVALPDSFPVLMPFRYGELERVEGVLEADDVTQLAYFGYFDDDASNFSSSDTVLNRVWELCKYAIKATTFAGLYVDGDRERIPYEADAYLNQLSHYAVDQEYAMARRTIEYFMQHPTWPTEWQQHMALMFYADYMYTGDRELIEKHYASLKHKTLVELVRDDGLISTQSPKNTPEFMRKLGFNDPAIKLKDIVDWPPAQKDTGWKLATEEGERDGFVFTEVNTVVNCFFYRNMEIMAEFARLLNKPDDEVFFRIRALEAKRSINEKLFDAKAGVYVDGEGTDHASLHANMMALAFDLVPDANKASVVQFVKSRGMACSVYGAQYLMDGLYKAGEAEYALKLLTATDDRSWWNMIRIGSTITLEAWDMRYKPNADWNHAWGAVPANVIPRRLWGIRPKTPGFQVALVNPQLAGLSSSTITVPTIHGEISGRFQRVSNRFQRYSISLPANMLGEFQVVTAPGDVVTLNGRKVNLAFGSIRLEPGFNEIEIKVNSF